MTKITIWLLALVLLTGIAFAIDSDLDGVYDHADLCYGTSLKEAVPYVELGTNRFALMNGDSIFDTLRSDPTSTGYITLNTCGCSCEQILDYTDNYDPDLWDYGCTRDVMESFADTYCHLVEDCNGELGGEAYFDQCGTCTGGNTGVRSCVQDCNDVWGGSAYIDDCNTCVGGNTGKVECRGSYNDSDGGVDFFTYGIILNHFTGTNLGDSCIPFSNYLFERHCVTDNPQNYTVFANCEDWGMICEAGACVQDPSMPPSTSLPVADAGGPYIATASGTNGASVILDGTDSSGHGGEDFVYKWDLDLSYDSDGDGNPGNDWDATGPVLEVLFPIGESEVALVVQQVFIFDDSESNMKGYNYLGPRSEPSITTVTVSCPVVVVDVMPWRRANTMRLNSHRTIPVAYLSDEDFDATTIDPLSITLKGGSEGVVKTGGPNKTMPLVRDMDVDKDGDMDLLALVEAAQLGLTENTTVLEFEAMSYEGLPVTGSDDIRIITK